MKVLHVVGSRSGFFRVSPVVRSLAAAGVDRQLVVYAGHRQDLATGNQFLDELELPEPDHVLGVSTGSSATQTGRSLIALEGLVLRESPEWIFSVGDADASLAAALVGRKNGIPLAHLEAGVRSGSDLGAADINRLLTDRLSDALFTAERATRDHLVSEGIDPSRVHFVGNTVADAVVRLQGRAKALDLPEVMGLERGSYVVGVLQSPLTSDPDPVLPEHFLAALDGVAFETGRSTILVLDSATATAVRENALEDLLAPVTVVPTPSYVELVALVEDAAAVVANGIEVVDCATVLGVPSIGIGDVTVGRATVSAQGDHLSVAEIDRLPEVVTGMLAEPRMPALPELWDGQAASRIAEITLSHAQMAVA